MSGAAAGAGAIGGILMIVGLIVAILWIFVPFAIFGTKPILRDILKATKESTQAQQDAAAQSLQTNAQLQKLLALQWELNKRAGALPPGQH